MLSLNSVEDVRNVSIIISGGRDSQGIGDGLDENIFAFLLLKI